MATHSCYQDVYTVHGDGQASFSLRHPFVNIKFTKFPICGSDIGVDQLQFLERSDKNDGQVSTLEMVFNGKGEITSDNIDLKGKEQVQRASKYAYFCANGISSDDFPQDLTGDISASCAVLLEAIKKKNKKKRSILNGDIIKKAQISKTFAETLLLKQNIVSSEDQSLIKSCRKNTQSLEQLYDHLARRVVENPELLKQKSVVPIFYSFMMNLLWQINTLRDICRYLLLVQNMIGIQLFSYGLHAIGVELQYMISKTDEVMTNTCSFDVYKSHILGKKNALNEFMLSWQRLIQQTEDIRFLSLLSQFDKLISEAKRYHVNFVEEYMQALYKEKDALLFQKYLSGLQSDDVEIDGIDHEVCFLCGSKKRQVVVECCKKEIVSKQKRSLAARRYTLLKTIDGVPSEQNVYKAKNPQDFTVEFRSGEETTNACFKETLTFQPDFKRLTFEIPKQNGPVDVTIHLNQPDEYLEFRLQAKHIDVAILGKNEEELQSWKEEDCARDLIAKGVLPQPNILRSLCSHYGRKSEIITDICTNICAVIRLSLDENLNGATIHLIYPAFQEEDECAIIFVILLESDLDAIDVQFGYQCEILLKRNNRPELHYVSEETLERKMTLPLEQQKKLQDTISEHCGQLFEEHKHLSIITTSAIKSKGFLRRGCTEITNITPVIRFCVRVKGYIPLNEDKFSPVYNGFSTDVIEGEFIPFAGKATDRLQQLQLGCEISRNSTLGGTLGGFALHPTYGFCGFTCAHALLYPEEMDILVKKFIIGYNNWPGSHSRSIYQPRAGNQDDEAGTLVEAIYDAASGIEIAFFKIEKSREPRDGKFPKDYENKDTNYRYEEGQCASDFTKKEAFWKFGCASNATRGFLVRPETAWCRFNCGLYLANMFTVSGEFACKGDSGALVFRDGDPIRMKCVGIVEGGQDGEDGHYFIYVSQILPILQYLDTNNLFDFRLLRK
ncbi:uncharacterized protein LOC128222237 isoform X2 [Mya arenaria]|uniref:uncharacterized protein LOC128222237 isoform X2 n=1 Tax=Mya arenaria TaxID=6604 RepID=UPI0022E80676|nr:uncharacterized protein LOC128222237 isoform X2 [Mya arenaria]